MSVFPVFIEVEFSISYDGAHDGDAAIFEIVSGGSIEVFVVVVAASSDGDGVVYNENLVVHALVELSREHNRVDGVDRERGTEAFGYRTIVFDFHVGG